MTLVSGTKLGPYEIQSPLGAGGMGEVYRARDTRLDRIVAIKVLPANLSSDPSLRQRLEREAKAISKLSHPHICTLHDIGHQDGMDFLVMEFVEGETLEQRLTKGPLSFGRTVRFAAQIADALATAHKQGITHRDLKPSNVMLTKAGAKLMDFGLAKQAEMTPLGSPLTEVTMAESKLTGVGAIVGTFQYMAPEQLEGKDVDARTDMFALGELIYEMATGKPAFSGKSRASLIAAILTTEPQPITQLQPLTPPALERVVKRCLAKDPDDRWQSASDLASELKWMTEGGSSAASVPGHAPARRSKPQILVWRLAAISLLAAAVVLIHSQHPPAAGEAMHFNIALPTNARDLALSPDGRMLAVVASSAEGHRNVLWLHQIGSTQARALEGTEGASYPFWSPDSLSIGFFADSKLKRVDAAGGVVQAIADASAGRGGTWNREGVILFTPGAAGETYRVSATGGAVAAVTTGSANASQFPRWPWFLPDGKHFLYTYVDFSTNRESEVNAIWVGRLDSSEKKRLVTSSSNAAYVPGYIVFMRGNTLTAHAFDSDRLETRGEAIALESSVRYVPTVARGVFSTSQDGKLVYQTGSAVQNSQLTWFDRQGKQLATVGSLASYGNPRISPDGRKVAVDVSDPESFNADIWLIDLVRGTSSRFSFDPAQDEAPVWSPDGKRLAWFSDRQATNKIMQKVANGSGSDEPLRGLDALALIAIDDWSSDGRYLLYTSSEENARFGLWVLSLDRESKPKPFLENQFSEVQGQFSPDGHWVAYCSNESGKWQVYVTPFPGPGGKYQVSTEGGQQPRWRRDGKELFFLAPDRKLMAVPAKPGETFEAGTPVALFQTRAREPISAEEFFTYDVTSDGQRFLINSDAGEKTLTPVEIVLNWTGGLKK